MSSVVPLVPWHIAISASRQSNNQQLECNEAEFEELEVIWPITGLSPFKTGTTGMRRVRKSGKQSHAWI